MLGSSSSGDVTGAANKTILSVLSAADRRPRLRKIIIGCTDGTPADAHVRFALRRITADGTGTATTPLPVDPADGVTPACTSKKNYTVEPTYAAGNLAELGLHQRATGVLEFEPGEEFAAAIGAGNGLGLQMISATAKAYNATFVWAE